MDDKIPAYVELSFKDQLDRAKRRVPKTYDSQGKEYYIGLTPGQIISCWWGDHAGICNKIGSEISRGDTNEEILECHQKEYPELMVDQLEWLRNRLWIEAGRKDS